jgi:predicted metalloprotease with PDZ domain
MLWLGLMLCASVQAASEYSAKFLLTLTPGGKTAAAEIQILPKDGYVKTMNLRMPSNRFSRITGDGTVSIKGDQVLWTLPKAGGRLKYAVLIDNKRSNGAFDALMTNSWAIFRGDKVFPKARVRAKGRSISELTIAVPSVWHANTGYERYKEGEHRFRVFDAKRKFDQPAGWMIVGKIANRAEMIAGTKVIVAGPEGLGMRRQDMLAFLSYNLPELKRAFGKLPPVLLIVSGPDPMWRGGLSGPNSLYLHMDRPMISENGTSALLHELTHSITRLRSSKKPSNDADWIVEGLAEFYGIESMRRSGGVSDDRFDSTLAELKSWSKSVKSLRVARSSAEITAKAVLVMVNLDREIRQASGGKKSLDQVTKILLEQGAISNNDFYAAVKQVLGRDAKALQIAELR